MDNSAARLPSDADARTVRLPGVLSAPRAQRALLALLTLAGALVFLAQLAQTVFTQRSSLDEGLYLVKGWLFASGQYAPYQPYGPWTNKMPLAFLFYGWAQALFGPGLRTGRITALLLAALTLLAVWLTAHRLAPGRPRAAALVGAGVVWALALNPALIKMYSQAISQVLVACLLAWCLIFLLGEGRKGWELAVGSFLAAVVVMTRENMLPLVPLAVLYVAWAYGLRRGLLALGFSLVPLLVFHALFWPGIMTNWTRQLPESLTPFLDSFRLQNGGQKTYSQSFPALLRLRELFQGFRQHYLALLGALTAVLLWPRRSQWRSTGLFKSAVFLLALFATLLAAHLYASLGGDYCLNCYPLYLAFFAPVGLLLLATVGLQATLPGGWLRGLLAFGATGLVWLGMGYTAEKEGFLAGALRNTAEAILYWDVPRFKDGRFAEGTLKLWTLLANGLRIDADRFFEAMRVHGIDQLAGVLGAILLVLILAGLTLLLTRALRRRTAFAPAFLALALAAGLLLSATPALGGGAFVYDCDTNVIAATEATGEALAQTLPPGARIDWRGGTSPAVLLHLPGARLYPPQLNEQYSLRQGGDADELFRAGFWNMELSRQWLAEADALLAADGAPLLNFDPETYGYLEQPAVPLTRCGGEQQSLRPFLKGD
jgi:hypothetical protein